MWYRRCRLLEALCSIAKPGPVKRTRTRDYIACAGPGVAFGLARGKVTWLASVAQLQMVAWGARQYYQAHLAVFFGVCEEHSHPVGEMLSELRKWQIRTLDRYDNKAFDILKGVEAFSKAYLIRVTGGELPGGFDAVKDMEAKYTEKERKAGYGGSGIGPSTRELSSLAGQISSPVVLTELFGMMKSAGSPKIDPIESAKKRDRRPIVSKEAPAVGPPTGSECVRHRPYGKHPRAIRGVAPLPCPPKEGHNARFPLPQSSGQF